MSTRSSLTDLPVDVLVLIFPYLAADDFLAFCSTCRAFHQDSIRLDPAYWRHATRSAFRVPNQPVVQNDGSRWQKLYRRLLTQSRVYTWGLNSHNRLGHSYERPTARRGPGRRRLGRSPHCSFPTAMEGTEQLGIIADMQCGGWSTTLLTSQGALYTAGVLDGQMPFHNQSDRAGPRPLNFPLGFPYNAALAAYEEPTVAIRQFSSGRSHILGLSDSGRIWSWYDIDVPSLHVKFVNVDITEASSGKSSPSNQPLFGRVKQVVAGWSRSSAYIHGTGIVVWDPVKRGENDNQETDTMLVMESAEVPQTNYQRTTTASRDAGGDDSLATHVGAVLNYILLEHYVVFVTDIGRIFCGRFSDKNQVAEILELRDLRNDDGQPLDVQGSFRRFAIFKHGEVITTTQDYLDTCWNERRIDNGNVNSQGLQRVPALQHNDVISIAFGDYHFLALHSNGKITSYGTECQSCGALGLGGEGDPEGRLRGIRYVGFGRDGKLIPHAYTCGRQVWFEKEKKKWITFMTSGGKDPGEAGERMRMVNTDPNVQGEVSEWFEQQGRAWEEDSNIKSFDEDGLGSYFALSVSAAGWHSGALVLVNENLAEIVRERYIVKDEATLPEDEQEQTASGSWSVASALSWAGSQGRAFLGLPLADQQPPEEHAQSNFLDPVTHGASPAKGFKYTWAEKSFPRLRLSDGTEMPGTVDFDDWRERRPQWDLDVDI